MYRMTKMRHSGKGFRFIIFMFIITSCLLSSTTYGGNKMEPLYDINDTITLEPREYDTGMRNECLSLFPVPRDNSVGTNDMDNAITVMSFQKNRIGFDEYFKNAADDFIGGGDYLPVISQDMIGFAQTRRFLLFDFRYKICRDYRIVFSIEKTIENIAIADARRRQFIFEIEAHNPKSEDPWDCTSHLMLMDLSDKEKRLIKEMKIGTAMTWSVVFDKIFLYDLKTEILQVMTTNFELSHHPLADEIKRNKGIINFVVIHPHPYLPFAILSGGKKGSIIITWSKSNNDTHILITRGGNFSFSPDGKWVAFTKKISLEAEYTFLMPISEKYPHYLGSPILLKKTPYGKGDSAWTTNPVSFVGSDLGKLYRWDLENRNFPEKGKMTFHEYTVQEDLKKLTREKRQGLGK